MHNCEKIENIKQSLNNLEELADIKNNPVVKATILSVVKAVPILGELIDSSMDICLTNFQKNKRNELIQLILSDVDITSDMVNDVEFILNFAKTLEAVNRLSSNDKIRYFANLIKNGYFTANKVENDLFDVLNDLKSIEYVIYEVKSIENLQIARKLDKDLREKYPIINQMIAIANSFYNASINSSTSPQPIDAFENLKQDYYGILCDTLLKKQITNSIEQFIEKVD